MFRRRRPAMGGGAGPFTVFLDRDGVLNVNPAVQVRRHKDLEWLPGAKEALARLKAAGLRTVLVTNQPATSLLFSTPAMILRLHAWMQEELAAHGAALDRIEVCHSAVPVRRRKPRPGMLEDAAAAFAAAGAPVDRGQAVMVGDKLRDAQAGQAFGVPVILVATTHSGDWLRAQAAKKGVEVHDIVAGLPEAAEAILGMAGR